MDFAESSVRKPTRDAEMADDVRGVDAGQRVPADVGQGPFDKGNGRIVRFRRL